MAVPCSHIVGVVVIDVGISGLIYRGARSGIVAPGFSGSEITLATLIWRTGPWFLVAVAWIHSVFLVVTDLGMLGLMLVWVG